MKWAAALATSGVLGVVVLLGIGIISATSRTKPRDPPTV